MELWVRSQDKKHLIKCEAIMYEETGIGYGLRAFTKNYDFDIGIHKTKERAIEVLDEIQNFMRDYVCVKKTNRLGEEIDIIPKPILIYNMPKE